MIRVAKVVLICLSLVGCATQSKKIALGMVTGAAVGALVGHQFVHHGQYKQYETRNTVITSIVFALATGGILAWHYRELEQEIVAISGRYARYRLCDPEELHSTASKLLGLSGDSTEVTTLQPTQIGKSALFLDDNTKWVYPVFRKRFLPPEKGETQVLSQRYIWEIVQPGSFVTRSQNPNYFFEEKVK